MICLPAATLAVTALWPLQVSIPLTTLAALATAVVGGFVAYQAYRGYRRNDSRAMLFLAVGILLLTAIPFLVRQPLVSLALATPAQAGLAALACRITGLLTVLYSFTSA